MRSPPRQCHRLAPDGGGERRALVRKNREASDIASEASVLVLRPLTMRGHRGGRQAPLKPIPTGTAVKHCILLGFTSTDVRFGSKADISARPRNVRFTSKSRHCYAVVMLAGRISTPDPYDAQSGVKVYVDV